LTGDPEIMGGVPVLCTVVCQTSGGRWTLLDLLSVSSFLLAQWPHISRYGSPLDNLG